MKVVLAALLFATSACAQMQKQQQCTALVKSNIEKTRTTEPNIFATIKTYMFEYSKNHDSCVMIMQYHVNEKGKPQQVQVIAINAVTMQPMEGYKNIFLIPESDKEQIMKATNFLFDRYSR